MRGMRCICMSHQPVHLHVPSTSEVDEAEARRAHDRRSRSSLFYAAAPLSPPAAAGAAAGAPISTRSVKTACEHDEDAFMVVPASLGPENVKQYKLYSAFT